MQSRLRVGFAPLLALALTLAACQPALVIPADLHTPSIAGVVATATQGPGRTTDYTLADGRPVTVDYARADVVKGSGNASVGDVLLADDTGTWTSSLRLSSIPSAPDGCFELPYSGVDDGDHIKFTNGLRLPKAAGFDPGRARESKDGQYGIPQVSFCVDATGFVTRYGW